MVESNEGQDQPVLRRQRRRARAGALTLVAGALLTLGQFVFSPAGAGAVTGDDVTIEFTAAEYEGECVPRGQSMVDGTRIVTTSETETTFTVSIELIADICDPIEIKAAIYKMPGTGSWPQTLGLVKTFQIQEAGTTVVTFLKGCERVQFDVLTRETPDWIHPDVIMHGPLLTPDTSLQFFGTAECLGTTTTAPSTLVPPPEVEGSTTVVETIPPTTVPGPAVFGATTVRPPAGGEPTATGGTPLAVTGSEADLGYVGAAMLVAGALLVATSRRHRHQAA
jgi:hypothetical protein